MKGEKRGTNASLPMPVLFKNKVDSLGRWWMCVISVSCISVPHKESSDKNKKLFGLPNTRVESNEEVICKVFG